MKATEIKPKEDYISSTVHIFSSAYVRCTIVNGSKLSRNKWFCLALYSQQPKNVHAITSPSVPFWVDHNDLEDTDLKKGLSNASINEL